VRRDAVLALAVSVVLLSGCGIFGSRRDPQRAPTLPSVPTTGAAKGGYYLDDGPGENPPLNLDAIADAIPRAEPLHRGAQRPYMVMGRTYTPMTAVGPYRARGVASWYGRRYHGRLTSTGEAYDMYSMSAAHPTLPLPSYVQVTSLANGKSVIVRVNDRGPFIYSRLIDLSYTAAYKLGILAGGSAQVEVEAIVPGTPASTAGVAAPLTPAAEAPGPPATERQLLLATDASGIHLQLGAFGAKENAEAYAARLRSDLTWLAGQLQVYTRDGLFRVLAGPFANPIEARQAADRISHSMGIKPFALTK
jgi:rare lipoprotein A